MNLIIVGSIALDSIRTPSAKVKDVLGGSVTYAAIAAKNFCHPHIVGIVGNNFPKEYIELFQNNNIGIEGLEIVSGDTFRWHGVYHDLNKAETIDTQLNVFADFNPELPQKYRYAEYLFLGNIDPDLQLSILEQMKNPKVVACDTMNYWILKKKKKLLEILKRIDIVFINDEEIKMLTQENDIYKAAQIIVSFGPKLIIIKQGENGSIAINRKFQFFTPTYPVNKVIDTTGAGDSFAGGFMGYMAKQNVFNNTTIKNALIYGTVLASFNIESFSIERLKSVGISEINQRGKRIKKIMNFN